MTGRLIDPDSAVASVAARLHATWAERVLRSLASEPESPITVRVRPGVSSSADVERIGFASWNEWRERWRNTGIRRANGVDIVSSDLRVRGVPVAAPIELRAATLASALDLLRRAPSADSELIATITRARDLAVLLRDAGATMQATTLRRVTRLSDLDVDMLISALLWLQVHPDLGAWTDRQLPIPTLHTKWLARHHRLVTALAGRDVVAEVRPRPAVIHYTYVDPRYLTSGRRRHDAWTTGDAASPAYQPRVVVVVENRDCRLYFPPVPDTIVVEGEGSAARTLATVDWLVHADHIVYWGDMDADGFAILHQFRAELRLHGATVTSILMTEQARAQYESLGVNHDKHGKPLTSTRRRLGELTPDEAECYANLATSGAVTVRRIEQERIPMADARTALHQLLEGRR